jgi:hypothetical protein
VLVKRTRKVSGVWGPLPTPGGVETRTRLCADVSHARGATLPDVVLSFRLYDCEEPSSGRVFHLQYAGESDSGQVWQPSDGDSDMDGFVATHRPSAASELPGWTLRSRGDLHDMGGKNLLSSAWVNLRRKES